MLTVSDLKLESPRHNTSPTPGKRSQVKTVKTASSGRPHTGFSFFDDAQSSFNYYLLGGMDYDLNYVAERTQQEEDTSVREDVCSYFSFILMGGFQLIVHDGMMA